MIEMCRPCRAELARGIELADEMSERDRVGSARKRDDDARLGTGEIVLTNSPPDAIEQQHSGSGTFEYVGRLVPEGGLEPPT